MKQAFVILFLLAVGTVFLSISYFLPEQNVVIVTESPLPLFSVTPVASPSGVVKTKSPVASVVPSTVASKASASPSKAITSASPVKVATKASPSVKPSPKATVKPKTVASPTATPSILDTGYVSSELVATKPEVILEEARIRAGRADPFVELGPVPSMTPPPMEPLQPIQQKKYKKYKKSYWKHIPPVVKTDMPLKYGLVLTSIIETNGQTPVAIVEINGKESKILKPGDVINNSINVVSINAKTKSVTLGKGNRIEKLKMNK